MPNTGTGNEFTNSDFLEVLLVLKENVMRAICCNEVCQVIGIDEEIACRILSSGETVNCIALENLNVNKNDIVLIAFCDTDFRANLNRIKKGKDPQYSKQEVIHTRDAGVIIGIVYSQGGQE